MGPRMTPTISGKSRLVKYYEPFGQIGCRSCKALDSVSIEFPECPSVFLGVTFFSGDDFCFTFLFLPRNFEEI